MHTNTPASRPYMMTTYDLKLGYFKATGNVYG